jgi:PAS domain S-box-containing protein
MSLLDTARDKNRSRQAAAYLLALTLPVLASFTIDQVNALRPIPFSIQFLSMALVVMLGGFLPAVLDIAVAILSHNYFADPAHFHLIPPWIDSLRACSLLATASLISFMNRRRHSSSHRLETALSELQDRTDALVQSLHNSRCASWTHDIASGQGRRWYSGSYQVFGRPFSEVEKLASFELLLHPDDFQVVHNTLEQMRTLWTRLVFEYRTVWPNGEVHWLESRGTRIPEYPCLWRGVTVDITDRKLAESALVRSEKLAAMGRLASTVAHEINNPLEAVTNLLFLARTDPEITPPIESWLTTAEQELARLANITRLTLGFVRSSTAHTLAELNLIVDEVLSLFRHRYELQNIRIARDESDPEIRVRIAPHELRQILTNLISNAADALSGPNPLVTIHITRRPDSALVLVEDNGSGIPATQLARIFEPFFTTKEDVGTGIGLWVTKELVEKNGGHISVESGDLPCGMKTRFSIELPLATADDIDGIPTSSSGSSSASPPSTAVS